MTHWPPTTKRARLSLVAGIAVAVLAVCALGVYLVIEICMSSIVRRRSRRAIRLLLLRRTYRHAVAITMHLRCTGPRQDCAARCCGNRIAGRSRGRGLPVPAAASFVLLAPHLRAQIQLRFLDVAIALHPELYYKSLLRRGPRSVVPLDKSYCGGGRHPAGGLPYLAADARTIPRLVAISKHGQPRFVVDSCAPACGRPTAGCHRRCPHWLSSQPPSSWCRLLVMKP